MKFTQVQVLLLYSLMRLHPFQEHFPTYLKWVRMTYSIHTDEMLALCTWLRSVREAHALSMRDLATRLEKPHSYIHKVEQGDRRLDVVEYVWYCEALGVSVAEGLAVIDTARKARRASTQKW